VCLACVVTNSRGLLGLPSRNRNDQFKSLQAYLSVINAVHNDFEYPPPACGPLVKLARKVFAELQGSAMIQPKQVTAFPDEHLFALVQFGLRPDVSNHRVRVCACLSAQVVFFSRADSGVLLTAINEQASASTFSVNQSVKFQLRWKCLRAHRVTDLYWSHPKKKNLRCNHRVVASASD
jgi:hypothetical protein